MVNNEPVKIDSVVSNILLETFETDVKIEVGETLQGSSRSRLSRYHIVSSSQQNIPSTIIVKQAISQPGEINDPTKLHSAAWRTLNEWAGLEFLKQCFGDSDMPVPRLLGGNREANIIVMEDLGSGKGLSHYLLGEDPIAAQKLFIDFFAVIGRIHAVTAGKQEEFNIIRNNLGSFQRDTLTEEISWYRERIAIPLSFLGISPSEQYFSELKECLELLNQPGSFQVYCHRDPCPDNDIVTEKGIKIMDFEFSDMGNAATDICYPRALFPTCWCVNKIPETLAQQAEDAYRAEFVKGCPEASDDAIFYRHLIAGCAESVMSILGYVYLQWAIEKDCKLGNFVLLQKLLARLDSFIQISGKFGFYLQIMHYAEAVAREIRKRLPSSFTELPIFYAFRENNR